MDWLSHPVPLTAKDTFDTAVIAANVTMPYWLQALTVYGGWAFSIFMGASAAILLWLRIVNEWSHRRTRRGTPEQ